MARIRTIKPEFPHSESMGRVSREARLCFMLMWTIADDVGRLRGNSRMLASLLYPYDDDAGDLIEGWLTELEQESCLERYAVDGSTYIQICNWLKHQKIDKPSKSKLPDPREDSRGFARESRGFVVGSGSGSGPGMEGKGSEDPRPAGDQHSRGFANDREDSTKVPRGTQPQSGADAWRSVPGIDETAMQDWIAHRVDKGKPLSPLDSIAVAKMLAGMGSAERQHAAVLTASANGWLNLRPTDGVASPAGVLRPVRSSSASDRITWQPEELKGTAGRA